MRIHRQNQLLLAADACLYFYLVLFRSSIEKNVDTFIIFFSVVIIYQSMSYLSLSLSLSLSIYLSIDRSVVSFIFLPVYSYLIAFTIDPPPPGLILAPPTTTLPAFLCTYLPRHVGYNGILDFLPTRGYLGGGWTDILLQ